MDKANVYKLYNMICDWFDEARTKSLMEKEYIELVVKHIDAGASILDLGCGMGQPIAQYFIERDYQVTGVDAAESMISKCRERFPETEWIVEDMRQCDLGRIFQAILAWDSFFHLPHDDQRAMFAIFKQHAADGCVLVFTSGPDHGEVVSSMDGYDFYHASLSADEYNDLLRMHGFKLLLHRVEDEQCGGHTVWVAQYEGT